MELDTIGKYRIEGDIHNQANNAQEKKYLFAKFTTLEIK